MATQKFTNFDNFLKEYKLIRQLSQNNLTKLFCTKLKSVNIRAILQKNQQASWPTQCEYRHRYTRVCVCACVCVCVCVRARRCVYLSDLTLFQVASSCLSDICSG